MEAFFSLRKPKPQTLPRTVNREGDKVLRLQAAHWGVSQSKPDVAFHGVGGGLENPFVSALSSTHS